MAAYFRVVAIDGIQSDQGKIAFVVFGDAHAAFDGVARMQVEAADLSGRDIDVVGAGKIGRVRAAEEAEAVGQDFERAGAGKTLAFFIIWRTMANTRSCLRNRLAFSMPCSSANSKSLEMCRVCNSETCIINDI